jgi:hypothetical protein
MPFNAAASLIQSELNGLDALSGVSVTGDFTIGFTIDFIGAAGKQDQPLLEVANAGRNEIQRLLFSTTPDNGTFRIEFDGQETADIPFNSSNGQIETFLESLPNIDSVSVSGDFVSGLQIEFTGADSLQPKNEVTLADPGTDEEQRLAFSLVPDAGTYSITFDGQTTGLINFTNGVTEIQQVDFTNVPDAGSFTLVFDGQQTGAIAFNANAAAVKSALEALSNIDNVTVTGDFAAGFQIEFLGNNINADVDEITVGANTLEIAAVPISVFVSTTREGEDQNAEALETALEALSNVDDVTVVGDFSLGFDVTFSGDLVSKLDVPQMIVATNTLFQSATPVVLTPSTTTQGRFPAQNVQRLGAAVVVTVEEVQGGLIPANSILNGATPITITATEVVPGQAPTTNLDRNGNPVTVDIVETTQGEVPANDLLQGATPVVVTPSTLVDAAESEPVWPTNFGDTIIDGDIIWIGVEFNGTPDVWLPNTDYDQGMFIQPSTVVNDTGTGTQMMFQVLGFVGTSSSVEPVFPTTSGDTIEDNNIVWIAQDPEANPNQIDFNEYYQIEQTVVVV